MLFGIDVILKDVPFWKEKRIGLITNDAATTINKIKSRVALIDNGFNITKLFSPEHGIAVNAADGSPVLHCTDATTQLPVISLYNEHTKLSAQDLQDIEILLFDVPDVGARFYTYLWTLTEIMEVAQQCKIPMVIADRPNPISGSLKAISGPMLQEACYSFLGKFPIPIRHSCTIGELASFFQKNYFPELLLDVIPVEGWRRMMYQSDWDFPFIPTSPAIISLETAIAYSGMCLLEATNLHEGRSTANPFLLVGAPWLNNKKVIELMEQQGLKGVLFAQHQFISKTAKYSGEKCEAVQLFITDRDAFLPVKTAMMLIKIIKDSHSEFKWANYPTVANPTGNNHLEKLIGFPDAKNFFDLNFDAFVFALDNLLDVRSWQLTIAPFLKYH